MDKLTPILPTFAVLLVFFFCMLCLFLEKKKVTNSGKSRRGGICDKIIFVHGGDEGGVNEKSEQRKMKKGEGAFKP